MKIFGPTFLCVCALIFFLIGGSLPYNAVFVSTVQHESAISIHIPPPSRTSLPPPESQPSRSSQNTSLLFLRVFFVPFLVALSSYNVV